MKYQPRRPIALVVVVLCFVLLTVPAYGYADPNTVGLVYQILTPLLLAAGACVTFLRRTIAAVFSRLWRQVWGRADV
jgi:hypothetical protein